MLTSTSKELFSIFVPVEPRPASRPQVSRYGVRYSKHHMEYQHAFKQWLKTVQDAGWPRIDKQLCEVELQFISTKAKSSRLLTPNYDIDNASKLILDCVTTSGLIWHDDKTIVKLIASKRFAVDEQAGTHFTLLI